MQFACQMLLNVDFWVNRPPFPSFQKKATYLPTLIMLSFPNAKINLGLYITQKRPDGYHNLQTVFYPLNWCDALEVIENGTSEQEFTLSCTGLEVAGALEDNILFKACALVKQTRSLPAIQVHLHKNIPMGAGLGGGSSDAAFFLHLLNNKFELKLTLSELADLAAQLGSDCPFFIYNTPKYAEGRGEIFSEFQLDLSPYYILCIYPNIHSSTAAAFQGLSPNFPKHNLKDSLSQNISKWKDLVGNDFEVPIFKEHPQLAEIKSKLYALGALYASLSGSGSALYGIFAQEPTTDAFKNYLYYLQKPTQLSL